MEKFLEYFQFSTAIPFGYLIFFSLCLLAFLWGIKNIISSIRQGKLLSGRFVGGILALSFAVLFVYANFSDDIDFNPSFSESDIIGNWKDGDSYIQFKPNGVVHYVFGAQYKARMGSAASDGNWKTQSDFNIQITDSSSGKSLPMLRVIKKKNEYRLIVDDFEDPDLWDHHLGFKRSSVIEQFP